MIGSSPLGSFGPAEKNVAKKKKNGGSNSLDKDKEEEEEDDYGESPSFNDYWSSTFRKIFPLLQNYLGFLVFSYFLTFDNKKQFKPKEII